MKLIDIYNILEEAYPVAISKQFASNLGFKDNSGILVHFEDEIKQILWTLDLTTAAVEQAVACGANCIITHHPVIFKPIYSLSIQQNTAPLLLAVANKISIISMHLNADAAQNGIDYYVAQGLGLQKLQATEHTIFENCQYGRVFTVEKMPLQNFFERTKKEFKSDKIWLFGNKKREIGIVASFCGAGVDSSTIEFMQKNKVDVVVSSDIKHNVLLELLQANIAVLQMTHYANENYGFYKMYEDMTKKLAGKCHYFVEENLL